jgi:hypothetical protein
MRCEKYTAKRRSCSCPASGLKHGVEWLVRRRSAASRLLQAISVAFPRPLGQEVFSWHQMQASMNGSVHFHRCGMMRKPISVLRRWPSSTLAESNFIQMRFCGRCWMSWASSAVQPDPQAHRSLHSSVCLRERKCFEPETVATQITLSVKVEKNAAGKEVFATVRTEISVVLRKEGRPVWLEPSHASAKAMQIFRPSSVSIATTKCSGDSRYRESSGNDSVKRRGGDRSCIRFIEIRHQGP